MLGIGPTMVVRSRRVSYGAVGNSWLQRFRRAASKALFGHEVASAQIEADDQRSRASRLVRILTTVACFGSSLRSTMLSARW